MPKVAYIKATKGKVENVIVAVAATDYPPEGYTLVALPDSSPVGRNHDWDEQTGFSPPQGPPEEPPGGPAAASTPEPE